MKYLNLNYNNETDTDFILLLKLFLNNYKIVITFGFIFLILGIVYNSYFVSYSYNNQIILHSKSLKHSNLDSFMSSVIKRENFIDADSVFYFNNSLENKEGFTSELLDIKNNIINDKNYNFESYELFVDHVYNNIEIISLNDRKYEISYNSNLDVENIYLIFEKLINFTSNLLIEDIRELTNSRIRGEKIKILLDEKKILEKLIQKKKLKELRLQDLQAHMRSANALGIYEPRILLDESINLNADSYNNSINFLLGEKYLSTIYEEEKEIRLNQIKNNILEQESRILNIENSYEQGTKYPKNISNYQLIELETFLELFDVEFENKNYNVKKYFFQYNLDRINRTANFRNPILFVSLLFLIGITIGMIYVFISNEFNTKDKLLEN